MRNRSLTEFVKFIRINYIKMPKLPMFIFHSFYCQLIDCELIKQTFWNLYWDLHLAFGHLETNESASTCVWFHNFKNTNSVFENLTLDFETGFIQFEFQFNFKCLIAIHYTTVLYKGQQQDFSSTHKNKMYIHLLWSWKCMTMGAWNPVGAYELQIW